MNGVKWPAQPSVRRETQGTDTGILTYNIDDTRGKARPAHCILLGSEIPIVEHMTGLEQLPETGFQFFAVPPKVKAFGTFPLRCFAILEGGKNS